MAKNEMVSSYSEINDYVSLFFIGIDAVIIIIILNIFRWEWKSRYSPTKKLSLLIILDIQMRIIKMFTDIYAKSFLKELIFTTLGTIQFAIIINFLNDVFTDRRNEEISELKIDNLNLFIGLFFSLTFSFKGILSIYKIISGFQNILIIKCIYILYKVLGDKIQDFLNIVYRINADFSGQNCIKNFPFIISSFLIVNYFFQIIVLLLRNKLYKSYLKIICLLFQEVGKNLVIVLLIIIYYLKKNKYNSQNKYRNYY